MDARRQGEAIIADAKEKAERAMNSVNLQILTERRKLEEVKRETQIFKGRLLSLYKSQITMLETIPGLERSEDEEGGQ
jgi:cell division septum initiation protein DivIVA